MHPPFGAMVESLEARVRAWMADDVEEQDRAELEELLERLREDPGGSTLRELEARFSGPLRFGTAGLRGRVEAGPARMNRATVIRTTAGLATVLLEDGEAVSRGVVLGRDARRGSEAFQADVAAVLAARGITVWWLPGTVPTPVVAFAVRRLGAAAGIMVTASHNPPRDNGYKVYWGPDGAQIVSPLDVRIAAAIDAQPGARHVPRVSGAAAHPYLQERADLEEAYLEMVQGLRWVPDAPVEALPLVYTAMHGVGGPLFLRALERRGFQKVTPVAEQLEPDPAFPTVAFPNPEEDGALDLAVATAERVGAELVLAHDPDADRLGAVVRCPRRGWRALSGNDIGVLLARYLIDHDEPGDTSRLVVNTVVSSRLLERMARDLGVRYAEALTGFKNIAKVMRDLERKESLRPLLGYEEALGYAVSADVRDKDGITAGLALAEMAAVARAEGRTLLDLLEALHRAHGLFVGHSRSVVVSGLDGPQRLEKAMTALRAASLETLRRLGVRERWDLQTGRREDTAGGPTSEPGEAFPHRANVLVFELSGGGRIAVRPSGTEPKLKLYLEREVAWPVESTHDEVVSRARAELEAIERGFLELGEIPSGR